MLSSCGDFLSMRVVDGIPKYLGLPLTIEKSKVKMFQWLEDKVQGKIQEWNTSFLSTAGKEALLKLVCSRTLCMRWHAFDSKKISVINCLI